MASTIRSQACFNHPGDAASPTEGAGKESVSWLKVVQFYALCERPVKPVARQAHAICRRGVCPRLPARRPQVEELRHLQETACVDLQACIHIYLGVNIPG